MEQLHEGYKQLGVGSEWSLLQRYQNTISRDSAKDLMIVNH